MFLFCIFSFLIMLNPYMPDILIKRTLPNSDDSEQMQTDQIPHSASYLMQNVASDQSAWFALYTEISMKCLSNKTNQTPHPFY